MQSTDEFVPSTTEPVFGSGLIQAKLSQQVDNETSDNENVNSTITEPVVNGQNEKNEVTTEKNDNPTAHTNGENKTTPVVNEEIKPSVEEPIEKLSEVEVAAPPAENVPNEVSSSSATTDEPAPQPVEETTPAATSEPEETSKVNSNKIQ